MNEKNGVKKMDCSIVRYQSTTHTRFCTGITRNDNKDLKKQNCGDQSRIKKE